MTGIPDLDGKVPQPSAEPIARRQPQTRLLPNIGQAPEAFVQLARQAGREEREDQQRVMLATFDAAVKTDPDMYAQAQSIARDLRVDPEAVAGNPDVMRELARRRYVADRQFAATHPILSSHLSRLETAQVLWDQVENLSAWERFSGNWQAGQLEVEQGRLAARLRSGAATESDERRFREVREQLEALPRQDGILTGFGRYAGQYAAMTPRALQSGMATATTMGTAAAVLGQAGPQAVVPEEIATVPAAFLTGLKVGTSASIAYQSFEIAAGNSYVQMMERGYDPDTAGLVSGAVGMASSLLEVGGASALSAPLRKRLTETLARETIAALERPTFGAAARAAAIEWAKAGGGEVFTEVLQEAVDIAGEEIGRIASEDITGNDLSSSFVEGETTGRLLETAIATAQGMVLMAAPGPVLRFYHDSQRARRAQASAQFFDELGRSAQESKLRTRSRDVYESYIARTVKDTGAAQLYVDREQFEDALKQHGIPRSRIAEDLPDVAKQLEEGADVRPDVVIPTEQWAARLAGTPLGETLKQHGRTDPDGTSAAEAIEHQKRIEELAREARAKLDVQTTVDEAFADSARTVEDGLLRQIRDTQTMSEVEARASAKIVRDFVVTQAARIGVTPEQFQQRYPLRVIGKASGNLPEASDTVRSGDRGEFSAKRLAIRLFETADVSTFLHEASHFFWHVYEDMAASDIATPDMRQDLQTLLDWFGVKDLQAWRALTLDQQRKHHEAFALNWEQYMHTGEAPSIERARLFRRIAAWLRRLYKSIRTELNDIYRAEFGTDLPLLTGDVRQVMDRMLASREQIERAQEVRSLTPLFESQEDAEAAGMNQATYQEYRDLAEQADEAAADDLARRRLRAMRTVSNARDKALTDLQRQQKEARKAIKAEVAAEVAGQRVYRARLWLRTGRYRDEDGAMRASDADTDHRLRTEIVQMSVPGGTDTAPLRPLMSKDGVHPDIVAEQFGYDSGRELIEDLLRAAPIEETIEALTTERMEVEHAELVTPEIVEQQVHEAIHNDVREAMIAAELRALEGNRQPVRVMLAAAKEAARRALGRRRIEDINARDFSIAAGRAAKAAKEAFRAGDIRGVRKAQRQQMVQHALARLAGEARAEIDEALRDFRLPFRSDANLAKTHDVNLVNAARSVLTLFGLGAADRTPLEWVRQVEDYAPDTFRELAPDIASAIENQKPYTELTLDEFRDLKELVDSLWFRARREKQVRLAGQKRELDQVAMELIERVDELGTPEARGRFGRLDAKQVRMNALQRGKAKATRVEHKLRFLDGGSPGVFHRTIYQPIEDAALNIRRDRQKLTEKVAALFDAHDWGEPVKIPAPELLQEGERAYVFGNGTRGHGKVELIGALLHTGNESNLQRLLGPNEWGAMRDDRTIDSSSWRRFFDRMIEEGTITKADMDLVQAVWDVLEHDLKPLTQAAHYDLKGHYFREVEAKPIRTPWGTYRGGYVPAVADPELSTQAAVQEIDRNLEAERALPRAPGGFTKSRSDLVDQGRKLLLDPFLAVRHIDDALLYAHMNPAMRDVQRVLNRFDVRNAIDRLDPHLRDSLLIPWMQRAAAQASTQPGVGKDVPLAGVLDMLRRNALVVFMFGNFKNALQNYTDLSALAARVQPRYLLAAARERWSKGADAVQAVKDASPFMADRLDNQLHEVRDAVQDLTTNPGKLKKAGRWFGRNAFFAQEVTQNHVEVVGWTASYNQAVERELRAGRTEEQAHDAAVREADSNVRTVFGDYTPHGISTAEAGSSLAKLLLQFQSYFIKHANYVGFEAAQRRRDEGAAAMAPAILYGAVLPLLLADAIAVLVTGDELDDDQDGVYGDDIAVRAFRTMASAMASSVPIYGRGIELLTGPSSRMPSAPIVSLLEAGARAVRSIDEPSTRKAKDALQLFGVLTGVPANVLARPALFAADVATGDVEPTGPVDVVRGLLTGRSSEASRR